MQIIIPPIKKSIGEIIRDIRRAKGIQQGDLAKLVNTNQSKIQRLETAAQDFYLVELEGILNALGMDLMLNIAEKGGDANEIIPNS